MNNVRLAYNPGPINQYGALKVRLAFGQGMPMTGRAIETKPGESPTVKFASTAEFLSLVAR